MQVEWKRSLHLGQVRGGVCGVLKEAMGRTDRKDYGQESLRRRVDLEDRGGVEWGGWGSRQWHLSTRLQDGSGSRISDQRAFINTVKCGEEKWLRGLNFASELRAKLVNVSGVHLPLVCWCEKKKSFPVSASVAPLLYRPHPAPRLWLNCPTAN